MVDGGVMFGQLPKSEWGEYIKPDRRNRIRLGLNSLLVQTHELNVLIDTGAGGKRTNEMKVDYSLRGNRLGKGIQDCGLTARDIDIVVLTNLHFDHIGGGTKLDRSGTSIPMFPKATYMMQKSAWEAAMSPNERYAHAFYEEDYEPLEERDQVRFLDEEEEVIPGIMRVKLAAGPCQGNQLVFIEYGSERIVYAGDLIPTPFHLWLHHIPATDEYPNDTLVQKRELLEMAISDGWLVVFGHGDEYAAGYIQYDRNGEPQLVPKVI